MIQLEPGDQLDTMEKILLTTGMINSMALSWDKLMQFKKYSGIDKMQEENDNGVHHELYSPFLKDMRVKREEWFADFGKRLYDMYEEIADIISGADAQSEVLIAITEPFYHAIHDQIAES